jgi:hypothetical protein
VSYLEIVSAVAAIVVPMITIQTLWIARSLGGLEGTLGGRLDRVEQRLEHIDQTMRDHAERIARLEARL